MLQYMEQSMTTMWSVLYKPTYPGNSFHAPLKSLQTTDSKLSHEVKLIFLVKESSQYPGMCYQSSL